MKIAFGMIVFNSGYVLGPCLSAVYPYASQIIVAEGPVRYWQDQGFETSTDKTIKTLADFPDPEKKLRIIHSRYAEKEEQAQAYAAFIDRDTDYLWHLDADEIYKPEDIEAVIDLLHKSRPTSLGFRLCTFFGGFERVLTGFEANYNTVRLLRWHPGARLVGHRPPTVDPVLPPVLNIDQAETFERTGAQIYHYSYVWPSQVETKVGYYRSRVPDLIIPDWYRSIWLPWVRGSAADRQAIEDRYDGVHEFIPSHRGPCRTTPFIGDHPPSITRVLPQLRADHAREVRYVR